MSARKFSRINRGFSRAQLLHQARRRRSIDNTAIETLLSQVDRHHKDRRWPKPTATVDIAFDAIEEDPLASITSIAPQGRYSGYKLITSYNKAHRLGYKKFDSGHEK